MKEIIINNKIYHLSLEYILGLFEGDGSIYVQLKPNPSHKFGKQIILNWDIHQHVIDVNLLHAISKFFNCGKVEVGRKVGVEESWVYRYRISNQNDILKILLPILKSNDMVLNKRNHDKNLFINICELIQNKEYITFQGQEKIADKTFIFQTIFFLIFNLRIVAFAKVFNLAISIKLLQLSQYFHIGLDYTFNSVKMLG